MPRYRQPFRFALALFWALAAIVFMRLVALEATQGDAFRSAAAQPLLRIESLSTVRGRILAKDGTVLACDETLIALAVHYRHLEQPPNARWLRNLAVQRLPARERRNRQRMTEQQHQILAERRELHERLAMLCDVSLIEWQARAARIQSHVEEISRQVNQRRQIAEVDAAAPLIVAEELDYHTVAERLPLSVVAEVEAHPQRYPGVRIQQHTRRKYPGGELAAHVLGHLGASDPLRSRHAPRDESSPHAEREGYIDRFRHAERDDYSGRMGIEKQHESLLRGERGEVRELLFRSGEVISRQRGREPSLGRDLVLTLDLALQRSAEALLDEACQRSAALAAAEESRIAGGAIVVLDVNNGAILAAASAPRFDPNLFTGLPGADSQSARQTATRPQVRELLTDSRHPLFDRTSRMALPPGSIFKTVAAVALLESGVQAEQAVLCRGFFAQPDRQRCSLFVRRGVGHGDLNLTGALAHSCNVYFFQTATELGPAALVDWSGRFGLGQRTGIDLPGEAAGRVPTPARIAASQQPAWTDDDTRLLAIGQGPLTATPLQVARLMAAVANGGLLVTPHVVRGLGLREQTEGETNDTWQDAEPAGIAVATPRPIPGLQPATLRILRRGLEQVVAHAEGTAHGTVYLKDLAIAGKTGTAETGAGQQAHAWFAGYAPAESPRVALVVVLEHSGEGSTAAGPVARRLVQRMQQLGHLGKVAD